MIPMTLNQNIFMIALKFKIKASAAIPNIKNLAYTPKGVK